MNHHEPRSIWLVTRSGVPVDWRYALVGRPEEVDPADPRHAGKSPGWHRSALTPEEAADPAYDAHRTEWRRVPHVARIGRVHTGRVNGRALEVHGLRLRFDDKGRAHPDSTAEQPCEPLPPDVELVDAAALARAMDGDVPDFPIIERGTLRDLRPARKESAKA